jgi:serine/threonine protein kinase
MDFKPGTRIKNYTLERQLGRGASGEVWKAYDETKTVAIKFMNENLMTSTSAAKHRERLIREVEALRRLQHPNIPTLYDYDLDYNRPYLAMRFVGGDSYDRLISSGEMLKIPLERRLEMIRDLAFALTAAHEIGIIHRDIKPANLTGIENPYLLDFSISLETAAAEHTQRFVGTTLYMSPDGVADRLSDNYSFAVVVYEIIFGRHPIYQLGDSIFNQFIADMRIQNRQWTFPSTIPAVQLPADLRSADLRQLDAIFERAIGKREQRYVDLREFVRDLRMAIFPSEVERMEEARVTAPASPPQHLSQPPAPEIVPQEEAEPEPLEQVSPEESNFLDKAFLNLPAVPSPPAENLEITSVEHSTVPYDYEAKQRKPVEAVEPEDNAQPPAADPELEQTSGLAGPEDMTMMEIPALSSKSEPEPEPEPPAEPYLAGPEDMTMMEIPALSSKSEPEPEPPAEPYLAGPEDMTMMEMPVPTSPPEPEPEPPPSEVSAPQEVDFDKTMMEIPFTPPSPASPPPAFDPNKTMLDIPGRSSHPPTQQPEASSDFTLMEMQPPAQEDFTLMEAHGVRPPAGADNYTMMEMQAQSGMQGDNFTQLEFNTPSQTGLPASLSGQRRWLVIAAVVVIVIVIVVLVLALASGSLTVS